MSFCCCLSAFSGYAAAIEWSSVQVERPKASTSGGQSAGVVPEGVTREGMVVVEVVMAPGFPGLSRMWLKLRIGW